MVKENGDTVKTETPAEMEARLRAQITEELKGALTQTKISESVSEGQPIAQSESVEVKTAKEDPLAVGYERINTISTWFSNANKKAGQVAEKTGVKIGRFFARTLSGVKSGLAAVVMADKFAKQGYDFAGKKIDQADAFTTEKIEKAEDFLQKKAEQGVEFIDKTTNKTTKYVVDKVAQVYEGVTEAGAYVADKAGKMVDSAGRGLENAYDFTIKKEKQLEKLVADEYELGRFIAIASADLTAESYEKAKNEIGKQYNNLKKFGEGRVLATERAFASFKKKFYDKVNDIRMRKITSMMEKIAQTDPEKAKKFMEENRVVEGVGFLKSVDAIAA